MERGCEWGHSPHASSERSSSRVPSMRTLVNGGPPPATARALGQSEVLSRRPDLTRGQGDGGGGWAPAERDPRAAARLRADQPAEPGCFGKNPHEA